MAADTDDPLADALARAGAPAEDDPDVELEIRAFHQSAIDSARKMILAAGFFYPLVPLLVFLMLSRIAGGDVFATKAFALAFGVGIAVLAGHVGLWWWAKRSPFPATLVALAIYVGYCVWSWDAGGWVLKIVGLFILGRAVLASNRVRRLRAARAVAA